MITHSEVLPDLISLRLNKYEDAWSARKVTIKYIVQILPFSANSYHKIKYPFSEAGFLLLLFMLFFTSLLHVLLGYVPFSAILGGYIQISTILVGVCKYISDFRGVMPI